MSLALLGTHQSNEANRTMKLPFFLLLFILLITLLFTPSCAAMRAFPLRASLVTPDGSLGYSSKAGLEVAVNVRSRK
jgi:hypothetical protein